MKLFDQNRNYVLGSDLLHDGSREEVGGRERAVEDAERDGARVALPATRKVLGRGEGHENEAERAAHNQNVCFAARRRRVVVCQCGNEQRHATVPNSVEEERVERTESKTCNTNDQRTSWTRCD